MKIGFVCVMNDSKVFSKNLRKSLAWLHSDCVLQEGYSNVSKSYNEAMKNNPNEVLVFIHQDVYLPDEWLESLKKALNELKDINWGVLGVAGMGFGGRKYVLHLCDRGTHKEKGLGDGLPKQVQTLDECLLVIKNDGLLTFDENLPSCDFYGADICLQAQDQGKENYVIDAYLHHNSSRSSRIADLPEGFWKSREYMIKKWAKFLPVATTCTMLVKE